MANLKFVDTHNLVAFLSKPEESNGFEQIVDFFNANPIKHALTVKLSMGKNSYMLVCWQKIIFTESSIRIDLQLADEEGVDCLPNSTIFEQLTLMGSKDMPGIEFSSTMASCNKPPKAR
ncbi:hypothetical protein Tco_1231343 [Tanacetum coccineum]